VNKPLPLLSGLPISRKPTLDPIPWSWRPSRESPNQAWPEPDMQASRSAMFFDFTHQNHYSYV